MPKQAEFELTDDFPTSNDPVAATATYYCNPTTVASLPAVPDVCEHATLHLMILHQRFDRRHRLGSLLPLCQEVVLSSIHKPTTLPDGLEEFGT